MSRGHRAGHHGRAASGGPAESGDRRSERGAITAELALALPAVVLVLAVLLVTVGATTTTLRCADAARAAARVAALGRAHDEVVAVAERIAGDGAVVSVVTEAPWVEVSVAAPAPGGWFSAGSLGLSASASAWVEP